MSTDQPDSTPQEETEAVEQPVVAESETAEAPEAAPTAEPVAAAEPAAGVEEPAVPEMPSSDLPELTLGDGAPADAEVDPNYVPVIRGRIDRFGVAMGTGRRKTAVARVRLKDGDGKMTINGRSLEEFFCVPRDRDMVMAPLKRVDKVGSVDVWVRVEGGGTTGQTGAIVLGIARALQVLNPDLHHTLSEAGFLTRDGRMVERKKYGLRKARRSFQFSKR